MSLSGGADTQSDLQSDSTPGSPTGSLNNNSRVISEQLESPSLEQQLDQQQLDDSLLLFAELFAFSDGPSDKSNEPENQNKMNALQVHQQQLGQLHSAIQLTDEEYLLLKMAYQEGLKLNIIARSLNMPAYQPGRLLKGILKRIEEAMKQIDFPVDLLKSLLKEENR